MTSSWVLNLVGGGLVFMRIQQVINNNLVFSTSQSTPMAKKPYNDVEFLAFHTIMCQFLTSFHEQVFFNSNFECH
jgi:hypothetical protein